MRPELVRASELLRHNTPEAVEQAIGLLQNTVYSFSMKVCGHREDAEDTMQDVLFRSLPHLAKLPDSNALAAWLYTVTRNRCRRIRRNHGETAKALSLDELMPDDAELQRLFLDGARSPESTVLRAEEHNLLHKAVLRIPAPLRLVLVLHDMEELETEQVAQILGLQTGTVRVRLHRARLAVRKEMARVLAGAHEAVPPAAQRKNARGLSRAAARKAAQRPAQCRELFAQLSEYLDGRVEPRTCEQMKAHIEGCPNCVAFLKDLRAAIERCKGMKADCDPDLAARMRSMLTREYVRMMGLRAAQES